MSRVCPSGVDLETISAAIVPAAPERVSTMTDCPRISPILGASARATISVPQPGANPTISRIGLLGAGKVWLMAALENRKTLNDKRISLISCMMSPGCF